MNFNFLTFVFMWPAIISLVVGSFVWYRRATRGETLLVLMMFSAAIWSFGYSMELASIKPKVAMLWGMVEYTGISTTPTLFFLVMLHYAGLESWITRRLLTVLFTIPALTIILRITNPWHGLIHRSTEIVTRGTYVFYDHDQGPWFWVLLTYSYLMFLGGVFILWYLRAYARMIHRRQMTILILGSVAPWAGSVAYIVGFRPMGYVDLAPMGFSIMALGVGWGVVRNRVLDVLPVARTALVDSFPDGLLMLDPRGNIVDMNVRAGALLGLDISQTLGRSVREVLKGWPALLSLCLSQQEDSAEFEGGEPDSKGILPCLEARLSPLRGHLDRVSAFLVVLTDVTYRKYAEDAARLNEKRLEVLFEINQMAAAPMKAIAEFALNEAIRLTQSQGGYVGLVSPDEHTLTMYTWTEEMARLWPVSDADAGEEHAGPWLEVLRRRHPHFDHLLRTEETQAEKGVRAVETSLRHMHVPVFEEGCLVIVAGAYGKRTAYDATDVTQFTLFMAEMWRIKQRKQAEETLRASEKQYRALFEEAPIALWELDLSGAKEAIRQGLGHDVAEGIGKTARDTEALKAAWKASRIINVNRAALNLFHVADRRAFEDVVTGRFEEEMMAHFGEALPVLSQGKPMVSAVLACPVELETLHIILHWSVVPGYERHLGRVLLCVVDVSERVRTEQERLEMERRMYHSQKLESLGVLAGGIAHDFNNLLMVISGNLELIAPEMPAGSMPESRLGDARTAAKRAAELTHQMLAYSGKGKFVESLIDLSKLVDEMAHLLNTSLSKFTTLSLLLKPALPLIQGDPSQIRQIVLNLLLNASEAVGDRPGLVTMRTGVERCDDALFRRSLVDGSHVPGTYVFLEVTDTGCGMDEETQQRLFEPFFSTKFVGRGLGMAAVQGIIRGHKGAITLWSAPEQGSSFKVYFPIAESRRPQKTIPLSPTPARSISGSVLVAEDEVLLRNLAQDVLKDLGLTVWTAVDGEEALQVFREHEEELSCVILDLTMPKRDGVSVFSEMIRLRPDIKVIVISGFAEQDVAQRFHDRQPDGILEKPFEWSVLIEMIRRALPTAETGRAQRT